MSDLFNILDADSQERDTKRACIVAVARAKKQCGKFFTQAASEDDFMARLALVTDKLNDIVREACIEQNTPDLDTVHHVLASELAAVYGEVMRSDIKDENIDPTDKDAPNGLVEHELDNRKLLGKPEDFKGKEAHGGDRPYDDVCPYCGETSDHDREHLNPENPDDFDDVRHKFEDEQHIDRLINDDAIWSSTRRAAEFGPDRGGTDPHGSGFDTGQSHPDLAKPCSVCGANDHSAMGGHDWSNGRPNANPAPPHPSDVGESVLERAMRDDGSTRRATRKKAWDDHAEQENFDIPSIPFDMDDEQPLEAHGPLDDIFAEIDRMSPEEKKALLDYVSDAAGHGWEDVESDLLDGAQRTVKPSYEASTKTAVETGDTYTQETVDLPKATPEGSDEPSPKIDKGNAGDELHTSQKPIDVPSVANPVEQQDVTQHADYTKTLDAPGVTKTVNADTPIQPEHNVAPGTQTFKNKDQANPVTSKWKVIG